MNISVSDIKTVRAQTGMGIVEVRDALAAHDGNVDEALKALRIKSEGKAQKLASRETEHGTVGGYFHADGSVGVMVELLCNTDFVSGNDTFREFARDVAMHIAWSNPEYISTEDVPQERIDAEREVFEAMSADKPEHIRERIVQGRVDKWLEEICLLQQVHINTDKFAGKTIGQLRAELSASTGENVVISRFSRLKVGD